MITKNLKLTFKPPFFLWKLKTSTIIHPKLTLILQNRQKGLIFNKKTFNKAFFPLAQILQHVLESSGLVKRGTRCKSFLIRKTDTLTVVSLLQLRTVKSLAMVEVTNIEFNRYFHILAILFLKNLEINFCYDNELFKIKYQTWFSRIFWHSSKWSLNDHLNFFTINRKFQFRVAK